MATAKACIHCGFVASRQSDEDCPAIKKDFSNQAAIDADWLLNNPDKSMGSTYHDAGSCWDLIDALRARFIHVRQCLKEHWDHMGYGKDNRKFEAAPMEQRAMLMIDDLVQQRNKVARDAEAAGLDRAANYLNGMISALNERIEWTKKNQPEEDGEMKYKLIASLEDTRDERAVIMGWLKAEAEKARKAT